MTDIFNIESEILRQRRLNLLRGQSEIVTLGDGRGTAEHNLYDGIHRQWVRWPGSKNVQGKDSLGLPFSVLAGNTNYICEFNSQVRIIWRKDGLGYQIAEGDPVHMQATGRGMSLLNAHNPQNQFITQDQLQTGLSVPVGGMLVAMHPWLVVLDDGTYIEYAGSSAHPDAVSQHQDLSPYRPGGSDTHRYAVKVFNVNEYKDGNEPLQIVVSTPKSIELDLTPADIEEALATRADLSCKAIWAYRLEYGQTVIRRHKFDRDLRGVVPGPLAIPDGFIDSDMIAPGAVGASKIADGSLTIPKASPLWLKVAAADPTAGDDSADGYVAGSRWINSVSLKEFVCTSAALGAAVWTETTRQGTVTSVGATSPLSSTGGTTPVISLNDTAVSPGSYTNGAFTVDAKGRLTAASSGTAPVNPPFLDTNALIKGSADATKLLRFEVDGFTTGVTRVLTAPNYDGTIATLAGIEGFSNKAITLSTIDSSAIGGTTPAAGAFTTVTGTTATFTSNAIFGPAGVAIGAARVVANAAASTPAIIARGHATGTANVFESQISAGTPTFWTTYNGHVSLNSAIGGQLRWTDPSTSTIAVQIDHDGSNFHFFNVIGQIQFRNQANAEVQFFTNNIARMRIGASGLISLANTSVSAATQLHVMNTSTDTNAVRNIVTIAHNTSGTPAAGFGAGELYTLKSSTTADRQAALIKALWNDATDAAAIPDLVLSALYNVSGSVTEREGIRIRGGSAATQLAFFGGTPVARPSGANEVAVATTAATQTTPYGYGTQAQADAIVTLLNAVRQALVDLNLWKGAA